MAPVEIRDLSKHFGAVAAVNHLSFDIEPGRVTGFLGPNGAGKSTTLRALLGLVQPSSGAATFGGLRYDELDEPSTRVGAVLEDASFHPYGIDEKSVLGEPSAGGGVQLADPVAMPGSQTDPQRVGEQVVVAVPPALVIKRDDEQVLALKGLQHQLTVAAPSESVAQPAGQLVEHRGVEQERADHLRLPAQNLFNQVVKDKPMASRERLDKPSDVSRLAGMGPGRQPGQLQPGRPSLGARLKRGHERGLQLQPH